jgi:hypothetical protein
MPHFDTEHPYWLEIAAYFAERNLYLNAEHWLGSLMSFTTDHLEKLVDIIPFIKICEGQIIKILLEKQRLMINTNEYPDYKLLPHGIVTGSAEQFVEKLKLLGEIWGLDYTMYDCLEYCLNIKNTPVIVIKYFLSLGLSFYPHHAKQLQNATLEVIMLMLENGSDVNDITEEYIKLKFNCEQFILLKKLASFNVDLTSHFVSIKTD